MFDELLQIGARIRELRQIMDIPPTTLADYLQIPLETYERYEQGQVDIQLSVLYKLANFFHVELSSLLTGEEPKLHTYAIVRKGKGITIDRRKEYGYESLATNFIAKKAEPFLVTVAPTADGTPIPLNSHPGQEFNYVLNGTIKIVIGVHEVILEEGDALFFDSSNAHGMKAMGSTPVRFLAMIL